MERLRRVRLVAWLAFGWIAVDAVGAETTIADPAPAIAELRRVAVRSYAAAAARTSSSTAATDSVVPLRQSLDAIGRDAQARGFADDVVFARKWRQVNGLVERIERARSTAMQELSYEPLPRQLAPERRIQASGADGRGNACATALSLQPGYQLDMPLAQASRPGSELWLRIRPADAKFLRLATAASPLDTELALFKNHCPRIDAEAVASNDDAFGLAAGVGVEVDASQETWIARVRNKGEAGAVSVTLEAVAGIRGRITDQRNGAGIQAVLQPVASNGEWGFSTWTEQDGRYLMTVDPGTYYVYVGASSAEYVNEFYPDVPCTPPIVAVADCLAQGARQVTVSADEVVDGVDVALNIGGRIAGTVRDRATSAPIADASVTVYREGGEWPWQTQERTDAAGRYRIQGLLSGNYYVRADANPYGSQLWRHLDCAGPVQQDCTPTAGTAIAVVRDHLVSAIDFDLPRLASIHAVANAPAATPENPLYWGFDVFDGSGNHVSGSYGSSAVAAFSGPLAPGTYFVAASAPGYFSQWWNGIVCLPDCASTLGGATPLVVGSGEQGEVSFSFKSLLTVSGRVTDAASGSPLKGTQVQLLAAANTIPSVGSVYTRDDGRYVITDVPPGRYYVWASNSTHVDAVYPRSPCQSDPSLCDLSAAIAVAPTYPDGNVAGIDIALTASGSIGGQVAFRTPQGVDSLPPPSGLVLVVDEQGRNVEVTSVAADGHYEATDLTAGTYFAKLISSEGNAQVYAGIDCDFNSCEATTGTPLSLGWSEHANGIDFDIFPTGYVFGRIVDDAGRPVQGVAVDLWDRPSEELLGTGLSNAQGYYAVESKWGSYPGRTFRASTDVAEADYDDQVYDGIACPVGSAYLGLCSLSGATPIAAPTLPDFATANFVLHGPRSHTVFRDGFDP